MLHVMCNIRVFKMVEYKKRLILVPIDASKLYIYNLMK